MALEALGKVTVTSAGTPVRVTATRTGAQSIMVQAWHNNTGKIWVGTSASMNTTTGAGVLAMIPAPVAGTIPNASFSIPLAPSGINAADIWIDADTNGEACIVTITAQ
jgi:hypothetical protein